MSYLAVSNVPDDGPAPKSGSVIHIFFLHAKP